MINPQRPLNSVMRNLQTDARLPAGPARVSAGDVARQGAAKKVIVPETVVGQKSRTAPHGIGSFASGSPVEDEPMSKSYEGKHIPPHDAMTPAQIAKHFDGPSAGEILQDAANLGRGSRAKE